jgi:hypothetical protein
MSEENKMRLTILALALACCAAAAGCGGGDESSTSPPAAGGDTSATAQPPSAPASTPASTAAAPAPEGTLQLGKITGQLPKDWKSEQPASQLRLAQYAIPAAAGDPAPAQLLVFNFGGDAGTVEANLKRWKDMMAQPAGQDVEKVAKVAKQERGGLRITTLDLPGTYKDRPFPASPDVTERPNYRMLAAVIENPGDSGAGAYYLRLVGPAKTVAAAKKGWDGLISSLKPG